MAVSDFGGFIHYFFSISESVKKLAQAFSGDDNERLALEDSPLILEPLTQTCSLSSH